jgi:hypothetical protein
MIIATIPTLFMLTGLFTYGLATNSKVAEMGRIAFAFGLLVVLLVLARGAGVRIL